jgi:hypothetical protein
MLLDVCPKSQHQLSESQGGSGGRKDDNGAAGSSPFTDYAIVFGSDFGGRFRMAVRPFAKVDVLAGQGDDGLAGRGVTAELGGSCRVPDEAWCGIPEGKTGRLPAFGFPRPHRPTRTGTLEPAFGDRLKASAPRRTRTDDPLIKSQLLYQLS